MSLTARLRKKIEKIEAGRVFGYADLDVSKLDFQAAAKTLERLQKDGTIKKMSKGLFYKPKTTVFGELKPDYNERIKSYLYRNGKRIGYETGTALYNRLNLTTQVPVETRIGGNRRIKVESGMVRAKSAKSYVQPTDRNYEMLGLLDALKDIKRIPDSTVANSINVLMGKIKQITPRELDQLVEYTLQYPPRVQALLGAILENLRLDKFTVRLKRNLNPLTVYKLGISPIDLPTTKNWNIR